MARRRILEEVIEGEAGECHIRRESDGVTIFYEDGDDFPFTYDELDDMLQWLDFLTEEYEGVWLDVDGDYALVENDTLYLAKHANQMKESGVPWEPMEAALEEALDDRSQ